MQRADIFYPQLTYPARGSREPQIKIEPIIARNTKTYPHKLGKRPIKKGKRKRKKLSLIEDKAALWRYYKKVIAEQEVMHVGDLEASAFFDKWKKVKKKQYDKNDDLFHELQAFVLQYAKGFTGRAKR